MTGPALGLVVDGLLIRQQPPYVVEYCRTPHTGWGLTECGMEAKTCLGDLVCCLRCGFVYCAYHNGQHRKSLLVVRDVFAEFLRRYHAGLERAAANPRQTEFLRLGEPTPADHEDH